MRPHITAAVLTLASTLFCGGMNSASAFTIRGTGVESLIGGDLTDPENDGTQDGMNYNAVFGASQEPAFGAPEQAFNVFNNQVGGGNSKFCCGDDPNSPFPANPITIDATFAEPVVLGMFTLTSGNDSPERDPRVFRILGSNDNGATFTAIYTRTDATSSPFTDFNQVLQFDSGADFAVPAAFNTIRFEVTQSGQSQGAAFQLNEIEYFAVPEPSAAMLLGLSGMWVAFRRRQRA